MGKGTGGVVKISQGDPTEITVAAASGHPGLTGPLRVVILIGLVLAAIVLVLTVTSTFAKLLVSLACSVFIVLQWLLLGGVARAPYQRVVLAGGRMTISRPGVEGGMRSESYDLAAVRDLHVVSQEQTVRVPPRIATDPGYFPHEWPERIAFTYHRSAHSFGWDSQAEKAQQIVDAVAAYDAQMRQRDGLPAEPNLTTLDERRFGEAAARGYDRGVPLGHGM